jgi:hypothetical protein
MLLRSQSAKRWLLNVKTQVQFQATSSEFRGGRSGIGVGISPSS